MECTRKAKYKVELSLICFFLLLFYVSIFSQDMGFSFGLNSSTLYDFTEDDIFSSADYSSGIGFNIGFSVEQLDYLGIPVGLAIDYQRVKNRLYTTNGGRGSSRTYDLDLITDQIALKFFPLIKSIHKGPLRLKLGLQLSLILQEQASGYLETFNMIEGLSRIDLAGYTTRFTNEFNVGLTGAISYLVKVNENWLIVPEYNYTLGLSNFIQNAIGTDTKMMSHMLNFGLRRMLN